MAHHHPADVNLAGDPIDLDVGHPGRPGRAVAGEAAVDVARPGETLALQEVALGRLLHRLRVRDPARALGRRADQFGGARILEVAQPVFHRIDTGGAGGLVDPGLVREGIRQGRHPAQPRCAQDRRHVVDRHAQVRIAVGRHRGAIAHLVGDRLGRHRTGQQQRQRDRAVGRIGGPEVVGAHPAVRVEAARYIHQLRRALGLPQVFLLAGQLHAHRPAHGLRQQRRIGGHVVGAVAAVTARGLHPDQVDRGFGQAGELREVGAQRVRILRAGPDREPVAAPVGQRAGRADRRVHLVGPDVGARELRGGAGQGRVDVALLGRHAALRRVVADRLLQVRQLRQGRPRLPGDLQLAHRALGLILALGDHAHEVADHHHRDDAGDVRDRRLVDRLERVADEGPVVGARPGRPHDPPVQHARHAHVVHEDGLAGRLGRDVDARHRLADHPVLVGRLERHVGREHQLDVTPGDQLRVGDAPGRIAGRTDHPGLDLQRIGRHAEPRGSLLEQPGPGLGGCIAQGRCVDLDRGAGDRRALVGRARRVAQHHLDAVEGHVELVGRDLGQRSADAGAEVDVAVQRGDAAVVPDREQDLGAFGRVAGDGRRLAGRGRRRRRRIAQHQQHAARVAEVGAGQRARGPSGHGRASAAIRSAASRTASRISRWVPQRHRLCDSASRTCASVGRGWRERSATVLMIIPFRQ